MNLVGDADDAAIVRSTLDLARHFGLGVVAEGIEDQATWDLLVALGCPRGQGYFLGKPAPPARLAELLAAGATAGTAARLP
jgi:EAL domain-containing protein (putative c-di-GMP-specific phosphodiesterase class I)